MRGRYGQWLAAISYLWAVGKLSNIKDTLQKLKPELVSKYNVQDIGLFGSIVRDDFSVNSDIDIIVNFSQPIGIEFIDLANYIEKKLNQKVDLVSKKESKKNILKP